MSEPIRRDKLIALAGLPITPRVVVGLFIALIGVVLTLDRLGIISARHVQPFWPLVIVLLGAVSYAQSRPHGRGLPGLIMMAVGGWLFLNTTGIVSVRLWELFWPVLLILIGLSIVRQTAWHRRDRSDWRREWPTGSARPAATPDGRPAPGSAADADARFTAFSFMSGVRRSNHAADFLGGEIFSFMGGTNLDLRQATIAPGGEAVIEIMAMMSGIELTVPPSWTVVTPIVPVMGGIEDKRLPPLPTAAPPAGVAPPRLVLRGVVIMGHVQIKS